MPSRHSIRGAGALACRLGVLLIGPCCAASVATPPPLDSIQQRVRACTPCHGEEGRATNEGYYPRIAGKPAGYLFNQLLNFRDGRRYFPMMTFLTERQRDGYLREFATFFASQDVPYPAPQRPRVNRSVLARGQLLARQGDAGRQIPACEACHGKALLGVVPAVPGLLGVAQEYLLAQLGAWKIGTRHADAPDCMANIAAHLTAEDLEAVTAWLAAQPVPAGKHAEPWFPQAPPVKCGSIEGANTGGAP